MKVLNATVVRLGLVSLFADIASEMLYPITPLFLTMTLGASMASVGIIEGVAEAVASLLKTYSGRCSDRIGNRKTFVWTGYLLAACAKPLVAMATSWGGVLAARGLDRLGKGIRTAPRDALLAESVPASLRGAAFGWHRAMDTAGAVVGPLLALVYLQSNPGNLRPIFLWAFIPGLIAVAIAFSVKDHSPVKVPSREIPAPGQWKHIPKDFKVYLSGWALFSLTNSSDVFLLLQVKARGADTTTVILLYCFYNVVYGVASPYIGGLSDKIGRKRCLLFGLFIFALVYLGFSLASKPAHFWVLFAIYGIYMAATDGVGKALAVDLVPASQKATALGILGTFTGLSAFVASAAAGWLWERVSPAATFLYGAAGAVGAVIVLSLLPKHVDGSGAANRAVAAGPQP